MSARDAKDALQLHAPNLVPGRVQTPTATLSVVSNSLSSSLVPQVGDGIFSSYSHSSASQDSSSLHSSHSAPLVVEGRSSIYFLSHFLISSSTVVQDDDDDDYYYCYYYYFTVQELKCAHEKWEV